MSVRNTAGQRVKAGKVSETTQERRAGGGNPEKCGAKTEAGAEIASLGFGTIRIRWGWWASAGRLNQPTSPPQGVKTKRAPQPVSTCSGPALFLPFSMGVLRARYGNGLFLPPSSVPAFSDSAADPDRSTPTPPPAAHIPRRPSPPCSPSATLARRPAI